MALIKCPECGRERVSDSAVACPECGFGVRDYIEGERKKAEEEIIAKEKDNRELEERKKKLKELSNKAQLEIKKINESMPPEKAFFSIDFSDKYIIIAVFLVVCTLLSFLIWKLFVVSAVLLAIELLFIYYRCYSQEKAIHDEIVRDWDKIKSEKIENLKKEYENKAKHILEDEIEATDQNKTIMKVDRCVPKCPICGSTKIKRLTVFHRFFSIIFLGPFSAKFCKQFECLNCECRW